MPLFAPLPPETRRILNGVPALIDKTFPLPGRFRFKLPADVAELSRLLTSGRGERELSYLGRPNLLSAYLRYFMPWNLYRLCRLLPGLDITLTAGDRITDLGCGPLTLTAALWICRPDLRSVPLEFNCIDRSGPVLEAGKKFFAALTASCGSSGGLWKIHTVRGGIEAQKSSTGRGTVRGKPAALVCAVNVFNEMYGDISRARGCNAEKSAGLVESYVSASAGILIVEPGFPRCGEFISQMRTVFLKHGRYIVSPCPHDSACPFPGGKKHERWCHFAFETKDAPPSLHKLSLTAGLPKDRAVLSFLFAGPKVLQEKQEETERVRIISDSFSLPGGRYGRYCCSAKGLVLLTGEKKTMEKTASGELLDVILEKDKTDAKSGAVVGVQENKEK